MQFSSVESEFAKRRDTSSDINMHMETLRNLASECEHITEFGTRYGNSTIAFLSGRPKHLVCYDIAPFPMGLESLAMGAPERPGTSLSLRTADTSRLASIDRTDLLFIDTLHTASQLRAELRLSCHVNKFLVLHDTETFRWVGEQSYTKLDVDPQKPTGLGAALLEFLLQGEFYCQRHYSYNNGLTILRRLTNGTGTA